MNKRNAVRILTYHSVTNNGAVLQAYSLSQALSRALGEHDVKIMDYLPGALRCNEFFKMFKPLPKVPLFYMKRYFLFRRFVRANLDLDRTMPAGANLDRMVDFVDARDYRALVVGSDNIWRISEAALSPKFPNIYWLSERIKAKKIAYAASAYGSKPALVTRHRETLRRCLNSFDLIGVRDKFTLDLVQGCGIDPDIPVWEVPDPTFLYDIKETGAGQKLTDLGIDLDRPILGILIFGRAELSAKIRDYYKSRGYQIVALSMHNTCADLSLGHLLNPFEWAEVFKYLTFCITDRFHGTIFCLKNQTPFISIEPHPIDSVQKSKIYSLLSSVDVLEAYADADAGDFQADAFLARGAELLKTWDQRKARIAEGLEALRQRSNVCIEKTCEVITGE